MTFGQVPNLSSVLSLFVHVLSVWTGQDLPSAACLSLLLWDCSVSQLGRPWPYRGAHIPLPTLHLPHFVCPVCESLELGVLLHKIAITVPRGISRPSELLGHTHRNVQTF